MQLKRTIGTQVFALAVLATSACVALADDGKPLGVVELFTSQGCSSCPPADAFFNELVEKGEVVALAYHVDYWNYLGWEDTLAKPQNTERQYAYMRSLGARAVYTPQVVVNGRIHVNGTNRDGINDDLAEQSREGDGMSVGIKVTDTPDSIIIKAGATTEPAAEANLVLVFFDGPRATTISRGANTGRTVTYLNAVSDIRTAGVWRGKVAEFELPKSEFVGKGGCVALLQSTAKDGGPGAILGAAMVRKP